MKLTELTSPRPSMGDISLEEARKAMIAKRFGGNANGAQLGGQGSQRRKKKGSAKSSGTPLEIKY